MSKPLENTGSDESPPELKDKIPLVEDVQTRTKRACDAPMPVDVLLLTVKDCEFLACYMQLSNPYRCWFDTCRLGYVYFDDVDKEGDQKEKVKVALLKCYAGSCGPGSSIISVAKAVSVLKPKAVISVGACSGLNTVETKLGDVVVCAMLSGQSTGLRRCVSPGFLEVIKHSGFGWKPPLKESGARKVQVHCDGEFLSGPQEVRAKWRREELAESHPQAIAIEMEGEGLFTAAFDVQIEWLIVKGIADYADGDESVTKSWSSFASVMAASVVSHILSNPDVFRSWPHFTDPSESTSKGESPSPSTKDPTSIKCGDSTGQFLKWCQDQLCSFYNASSSQVMITPWDPNNTVDIDGVYVELSFVRDERKPAETTKEELYDYCEVFEGRGPHMIPKRILVYGGPGFGKSTFTKKLAVDWSRGKKEALKRFDVLLLVKLRDVCNTPSLPTMLKKAELLSADNPAVFDQLYDHVLQNQHKVLLVLDGFDEYSAEKSSVVDEIWRGSHLRDCSVLVTTRPTRDAELTSKSHAQFEINGFSYWQIERFALKYLKHEDLSEFMEFLSQHDLRDMAKVPLLLLMLCLTWKEKNQDGQPTSRAEVYQRFLETLFYHLQTKFPGERLKSVDEYKEDLSKLGKVAFDALLEDCLYVKLSHLPEDIRPLIHEFVQVGFFQISKLSSSPRPEQVVCFLHKSFQEYIAACYIVQELRNAKKESPACLPKVDSFDRVKKMDEVLKFSCGLSSEAAGAVLSHLRIIGEKEGLTECRLSETPHAEDLSDDQRVFRSINLDFVLSCRTLDRQALCPLYFHAVNNILVIDKDSQVTLVARDHVLRFSILPEPCYLLFPKRFDNRDKLFSILKDLETVLITCYGETVDVPDYVYSVALGDASWFLKREGQQMMFCFSLINVCVKGFNLLRALTSAPESPSEKHVDHLPQNQDNSKALHSTENTSVATVNHSLSFTRNFECLCATTEELTTTCNVLRFVKRPRIISIVDMRCDLGELSWTYLHEGWNDSVSENLCHFKEVTELKLLGVGLECEGGQLLATAISHLCQLRKLDLSVNPLGQSVIGLVKHLPSLPHLIELHLRITLMGKEEVIALARSLPSISKLEKLDLSDNPLGQGLIELAQYLTSMPHLTELGLRNTRMGEEEVGAVVRALKYICELEVLHLSRNPLGRGVSELIQHLSSVPQLRFLYLTDVKMTKKEASELDTAVRGTNIRRLHSDYVFLSEGDDETRRTSAVYDDSEEPGWGNLALAGSPGERVKEEGVTWYLEQGSVRITFHPGAVTQPTLINCSLWSPRVLSPPLHCNEALVSNVIEVFLDNTGDAEGEVTVALLHSACKIEGYELVIKQLVDPDNEEWIDLKTQGIRYVSGSLNRLMNFAEASCLLTCRSVFAVIWRLKSFQFSRQNSVAPDFTCILPDYPDVSVTIPSNSVPVNEDFCLTVKVHEFRSSKVQTERLFFGPVLHISCSPNVTLLEAATIKIPLWLHKDKGLLDTDLSSGHLRILHYSSTKEGSPTWTEITQTLETNATVTDGIVTLQVKHFCRFALVMDWVEKTFAVVKDIISDLYRRLMAQWAGFKAYLCQDEGPNKYVLTLFCYPIHLESKVKDLSSEHVVVMQGKSTSSIPLCEQDTMSVHLSESFSVKQEILESFYLMFWEKEPTHNSLRVNRVLSTDLNVTLFLRWKGEETTKLCTLCLIPRSPVQVSPHATFENWPHGDLFNREENMPQPGRSPGLTVKEGNPTEEELESLAGRIGEKWKPLGRRLNFDDSSLTGFDRDHSEYREKVYAMLSEWKQQGGAINATYQILYEALCHELVACRDLAETFCCQ